ncbi:MAG TPA: type II toxin-antitoxin system PrlF family antitoxin [Longimicrobium sp.]|nr:type II toxin-antitoxin system PrlF family antitoxin [Longimicrobium sp.]
MLKTRVSRRWRSTVPAAVRKALNLTPGDRLIWEIQGEEVIVRRGGAVMEEDDDPALEPFFRLLASDMEAHPERLRGIPEELYQKWMAITAGVEVDPNETFDGAVCL